MILLDTNVVSEALQPLPAPTVLAWLDARLPEALFLSAITVSELLFGVGVLPAGRRKATLLARVDLLLEGFAPRILPLDTEAARHHARIAAAARRAGRGCPTPDGYIAAIAAARGFTVASRDTSAFAAAGLSVINPWG